jgi:hypothetical protein
MRIPSAKFFAGIVLVVAIVLIAAQFGPSLLSGK